MESDDLLLNFTTSAAPNKLTAKKLAKITGVKPKGSWRDRRDAYRRDAEAGDDSRVAGSAEPSSGTARTGVRTPSHPRDSLARGGRVGKSEWTPATRTKPHSSTPLPEGIVSSLFTFNPSVSAESSSQPTEESAEATNAPLQDDSTFNVNPQLTGFLKDKLELLAPTQVQAKSVPAIKRAHKEGSDVVMVSQTGSGKTLGYLLPILDHLMTSPQKITRTSGISAVILAPTRELAAQIFGVCESLCRSCHYIVPGLVSGGEKKKSEKARLRKGVNILVGTPGRMADHVDNTLNLDFHRLEFLVLDEGDRLIDLGFEETLRKILAKMPERKTTVLCSATMNAQTSRLKSLALTEPVIDIREEKLTENTPAQLMQRVVMTPAKLRLVTLCALVNQIARKKERGIVFFSCMDSVDFHHHVFKKYSQTNVYKLHGNMDQNQRNATITQFTNADGGILLTTDVASRGLDLVVDEVVEYDPPFSIEDHLHRAGRTARAGMKGKATMLLLPSEEGYCEKLRSVHPTGLNVQNYQRQMQTGFGFSDWQDRATAWQLKVEKDVVANTEQSGELAKKAFTAAVRAYTTHPHSERAFFNFRDLHLGHLAKAFALREAPKSISDPSKGDAKQKKKSPRQAFLEAAQKQMALGEFNVA